LGILKEMRKVLAQQHWPSVTLDGSSQARYILIIGGFDLSLSLAVSLSVSDQLSSVYLKPQVFFM